MTREEMAKEALGLIDEIEKYSPGSGAQLRSIYKAVVVLSCSDADTKYQTFDDAQRKVMDEQKKAEENAEKVRRLGELLDDAMVVKCGGS